MPTNFGELLLTTVVPRLSRNYNLFFVIIRNMKLFIIIVFVFSMLYEQSESVKLYYVNEPFYVNKFKVELLVSIKIFKYYIDKPVVSCIRRWIGRYGRYIRQ